MKTLLTLAALLFKDWSRSRAAVFFGILFPVMLLLVFGSVFGNPSPPNYTLYVRNLDIDDTGLPGNLSQAFINILNSTVFNVKLLDVDENPRPTSFAYVRVLTIPKGFSEGLINKTVANRVGIVIDMLERFMQMGVEDLPPQQRENIMRSIEELRSFQRSINASSVKLVLEGSGDDRLLQPIEGIINNIA